MRRGKSISILICILMCLVSSIFAYSQTQLDENHKLIIFYSPTCHKCSEVENKIIPDIEREFKGRIQIEYRDITNIENYKLLLGLKEEYGSKIENILPLCYFQGHFLNGRGPIKEALRVLISQALSQESVGKAGLPAIDLIAYFKTFKTIGILTAGLEDGINPCAFTVIVFFISYLALQGYRKKELIAIGFSFITTVFFTYFLIGLGLFNVIYSLEKFLLVRKIFNICVGILSVLLGVLTIYDVLKFKRTGETEGMILQLPKAVKNQIHSIIGLHYRKPKEQGELALKPHTFRLIISAFVTAFLVSFLELVCTGQLYLPTINFVLKTTPFKLQALIYLLLYNLMFITPLVIIFLFALLGTTSQQFSRILKKHLSAIKILMAVLFFGLGIFLIWGP